MTKLKGVFQLSDGMWGFRYTYIFNGKQKDIKRTKDEKGNPFKNYCFDSNNLSYLGESLKNFQVVGC